MKIFSVAALVQFVLFALLVGSSVGSSDESIQHQQRRSVSAEVLSQDSITSARDATAPDIARKLKKAKATKEPKGEKQTAPKSSKSSAPSPQPSNRKASPYHVFYSNNATQLSLDVGARGDTDDDGSFDTTTGSLNYLIDLGVIRGGTGRNAIERSALVHATFTTSLFFDADNDDDEVDTEFISNVFLTILAYSGCDSVASCANVTPTPLIPERIVMKGWEREIDIDTDSNDFEDFDWDDTLISTNEATFILTGKGTDNIFLQGLISIGALVMAGIDERNDVSVIVNNWVIVVDEEDDMMITESNGYLSPSISPAPSAAPSAAPVVVPV